jgi:curved DNA-binding protein CbpA
MLVNYYAILGISEGASAEEIRRAYHKAAMAVHPDRGGSDRLMQRINEAWNVLGDARQRREYDARRREATQSPRPTSHGGVRTTRTAGTRPAKKAGPRPPTFARIAGSLLGRALNALGGWVEPPPKAKSQSPRHRGARIVRCRRCGQKLRVDPAATGRIRCPKCRYSQVME